MTEAVIALGANLGNPQQQLMDAFAALKAHPSLTLVEFSSLYGSPPMGPQDQPDYVNAVAIVTSDLSAANTLKELHRIEDQFGRQRLRHWGERTLDLDLLLFGDVHSDSDTLKLPHPGLYERAFVLYPLAEIRPEQRLPNGYTAAAQAQQVSREGLRVVVARDQLFNDLA